MKLSIKAEKELLKCNVLQTGASLIFVLILKVLIDLNLLVAQFRDLLLGVGSARDCPELREKIRNGDELRNILWKKYNSMKVH